MPTQTEKLKKASTLKEWCDAYGKPVPGVEARSFLYEALRLGPKSTFTGTAEQNRKLLVALKKENGLF